MVIAFVIERLNCPIPLAFPIRKCYNKNIPKHKIFRNV